MPRFSTCCLQMLFFTIPLAAQQPGMLDSAFADGGKTTLNFGSGDDYGQSVVVQEDGKLVVAGYATIGSQFHFALARYLPDGRPDSTFSSDGRQSTSFGTGDHRAYAVALQPDGKIVVAGYATVNNEFDFAVARYKTDGSLDASFSGDGKTTTNVGGFFDKAYALLIQPDGKIVLGGVYGQNTNSDFALVRYLPNGQLDPTFGNSGIATLSVGNSYDELHGLALQDDGKIVGAGFTDNGTDYDFAVARFTTNGQPDLGFNGTGKQSTDIGLGDYGQAVGLQAGGAIIVLGYTATTALDYDFALVRYLADGTPDPAFGTMGLAGTVVTSISPSFDAGYALALQADGKILAGGYTPGAGHPDFALLTYLHDGTLDETFGVNGVAKTDFSGGTDQIAALAIDGNNNTVAVGRSNNGSDFDFAVARYFSVLLVGTGDITSSGSPLSLAPNPVNGRTVLHYDLEKEQLVSLYLYDFSGKLMQSFFVGEEREAGPQQEVLNLGKNIPAGRYLLVLSSASGKRCLQVVKN